jgi:tRNA pseudouridine38-40 synthase
MIIMPADSETWLEAGNMSRYFIEVSYKGTRYSGFQLQENANTIQAEIQNVFAIVHRKPVSLTGSSRTDAGVHALQNYFHFDFDEEIHPQFLYKANALLPSDIAVKRIIKMRGDAHCRFDAESREYEYRLARFKDPFTRETAFYYPYQLDFGLLEKGAKFITSQESFFAFAKTNSQVKHYNCRITKSCWIYKEDQLIYNIQGNRFLRGMVRLITATLLKLGRGNISFEEFEGLFGQEKEKCRFSVPPTGLFLKAVNYPENYFP